MPKERRTTIVLPAKLPRFSVVMKRGGGGPHKDKRTKRRRTRNDQLRAAINE